MHVSMSSRILNAFPTKPEVQNVFPAIFSNCAHSEAAVIQEVPKCRLLLAQGSTARSKLWNSSPGRHEKTCYVICLRPKRPCQDAGRKKTNFPRNIIFTEQMLFTAMTPCHMIRHYDNRARDRSPGPKGDANGCHGKVWPCHFDLPPFLASFSK